jgi:hypothetical protein
MDLWLYETIQEVLAEQESHRAAEARDAATEDSAQSDPSSQR